MKKLLFISFFFCLGCQPFYMWQKDYPDNYLEEYLENAIESKTGYDVDLSPLTGDEKLY